MSPLESSTGSCPRSSRTTRTAADSAAAAGAELAEQPVGALDRQPLDQLLADRDQLGALGGVVERRQGERDDHRRLAEERAAGGERPRPVGELDGELAG